MENMESSTSWNSDRILQDIVQQDAGLCHRTSCVEMKIGGLSKDGLRGAWDESMRTFNWLTTAWFLSQGLDFSEEESHSSLSDKPHDGKDSDVSSLIWFSVLMLISVPLTHVLFMVAANIGTIGIILVLLPALFLAVASGSIFEILQHRAMRWRGLIYSLFFLGCGLYSAVSAWWVLICFGWSELMSLHGIAYTLSHSVPILYKALVFIGAIDPDDLYMEVPNWIVFPFLIVVTFISFVGGILEYKYEAHMAKKQTGKQKERNRVGERHR